MIAQNVIISGSKITLTSLHYASNKGMMKIGLKLGETVSERRHDFYPMPQKWLAIINIDMGSRA